MTVYGNCGIGCQSIKNCDREVISREYKFYLAFENSICTDYITEKFFNYLKHNIILVVLGGGKYDEYVPKSAYINALDYKSPKDLADYLIYLSNNKTAYNEYFKWKKYLSFYDTNKIVHSAFLCEMCIQLHMEEKLGYIKKQLIEDKNIDKWFGYEQNCKSNLLKQVGTILNLTNEVNSISLSNYMTPE